METAAETNQNNRELTITEIKIALAEIEDRLKRAIGARKYLNQKWDDYLDKTSESGNDDCAYEKIQQAAKSKYNIPYGVCLFKEEGLEPCDVPLFMKFAKWWIKGEMTDEIFDAFSFHFCEIIEVDYFWVLINCPAFYYAQDWNIPEGEKTYKEMEKELRAIGTRSKKKAKMNFLLEIGHATAVKEIFGGY